jgi:uncharacterized membrane protein YhaH (DUF805 family)
MLCTDLSRRIHAAKYINFYSLQGRKMSDPYAKPQADLGGANSQATYQPKFLSTQGRIGRLRYLAYSMGASFLLYLVAIPVVLIFAAAGVTASSLTSGEAGAASAIAMLAIVVLYIAMIAISFIYAKRRLNDLGQTGWLSLLMLVPLVNLILAIYILFFPGQPANNQYGAKPVSNTTGVVILAFFPLLIFILGIVAAVSLPAYQDYVQRAEQAQSQLQE